MLHASISAYANRNRILARLVASFLLLFTTSGDVVCSKFGEVCEALWIFKAARCMRDRWPKINKSPTVSNGVGASSFEIWTANLAVAYHGHPNKLTELHLWRFKLEILPSRFPRRPPKTWHSDADISDLGFFFFMPLFLSEKNQNLLDIQEHSIRKLGKIRSELKLLFDVYYWFIKLYTGIIWHSYFPLQGIS